MGPIGEFILEGKENRFSEYLEIFRKNKQTKRVG